MKQKRELRSSFQHAAHDQTPSATETVPAPCKLTSASVHFDNNETSYIGRGRGRPRKIITTTVPLRSGTYGRVSEFSLISPPNKQISQTVTDMAKTTASGINPEETEQTAKRTVSKRANRGINPKYDSQIYLGLSGNTNQSEVCENPTTRPFTLVPEATRT